MGIKYLIKFVSKEEYAQDVLDGNLFMHCSRYYHMLENRYGPGQGDIREASIIPGIAMYKNAALPIYCLYAVEDDEVINGKISIDTRILTDFNCEKGYLVLIEYKPFVEVLDTCETKGYQLDAGLVSYGVPSKELSKKFFEFNEIGNLFIKNPYFKYQKEYRIVVCKRIDEMWESSIADGKNIIRLAPEKMIAIYHIPHGLRSFAQAYSICTLSTEGNKMIIPVNVNRDT